MEGLNIESMKKSDLVLMDCRKPLSKANKEELVSILRSIGFLKQREGMKHFYRYAVRILMSPTPDLIHTIQSERETMGPSRYPIGVHARCGGMLSDVHESRAMVTPSILKTIPRRVKRHIKGSKIPKRRVYVYLATDSSIAFQQLIPVKSTTLYPRGHSENIVVQEDSLHRSIIELYLMVSSKSVLLSSHSGYSRVIRWIGNASMVRWIRAPYVVNATANTPFELFYSGCGVSCYSQRCEHFKCSLAEYLVFQERDNALRTNRNTEDGTDGRKEEVVSARESISDGHNNA